MESAPYPCNDSSLQKGWGRVGQQEQGSEIKDILEWF